MVILGIDPGTTKIGYGIIEKKNNKLVCLGYGIIAHHDKDKLAQVKAVINDLSSLILKYKPEAAALEKLFFFKNKKTVIDVSEMRGVIIAALANHNISLHEFTPLQVKQSVSSYGRADKIQVESMVRLILNLKDRVKPDDAADGLAIAICCANTIL